MPTLRYRLSDGAIVPRQQVNRHHPFWEKGWYTPKEDRDFRSIGGLVIPLWIPVHDDIHSNVLPPPKPSKRLQEQVAEYQRSLEGDVYDQFYQIAHFIGNVANTAWSDEKAHEALAINENLIAQSTYIERGRVEPVYE